LWSPPATISIKLQQPVPNHGRYFPQFILPQPWSPTLATNKYVMDPQRLVMQIRGFWELTPWDLAQL
jgi:hypothetical protein